MALDRLTRQQTRDLLQRERAAQRQLIAYYGEAIRRTQGELADLLARIQQARDTGQRIDARWLEREQQYQRWLALTRLELARYVQAGEIVLRELQQGHASTAVSHARDLIAASLGSAPPATVAAATAEFTVPPAQVARALVGRASDGTPLGDLLSEAVGGAHEAARQELVVGVLRGHGPRKIARNVRAATGLGLTRSMTIARTESLGAYRDTLIDTYRVNRTVTGWVWHATLDSRTCAVCWAMHGTEHQLDEQLSSHPNCRCIPVPRIMSWRDLGIDLPDSRPQIPRGVDVFAGLPDADKLAILGRGKLDAYNQGLITLEDLVQPTRSRRWGPGKRETPLKDLL